MRIFKNKEHAKSLLEMAQDHIKTYRAKGMVPSQNLFDIIADAESYLKGDVQLEGISGAQVFGHPQATNIHPELYGNLIPIKISSVTKLEQKLNKVQMIYDKLNKTIAEIQYKAKQGNKTAKNILNSMNFDEDIMIRDLIHAETIPELNRLHKILKAREKV